MKTNKISWHKDKYNFTFYIYYMEYIFAASYFILFLTNINRYFLRVNESFLYV